MSRDQTAATDAATDVEEDEVVEGDVVEEDEDPRPTLAEYETAKAAISASITDAGPNPETQAEDAYDAALVEAMLIVDAAEAYGVRPGGDEAAERVTEAMLPAVREDIATAVTQRSSALEPVNSLPDPQEWEAMVAVAERIASTPFVPQAYRGDPHSVIAAIMYGRELGIGPMMALKSIHMIDGKPAMSAELMLSQMRKRGVVLLETETTATRAMIRARRKDTGEEAVVEWTIEEARAITTRERGQTITLDQKATWRSYPADMLWARCVGRLARRLCSDLMGGMIYAAEEMQDWDKDDKSDNYGVGSGYQAGIVEEKKPATSKGVEARADAPRSWRAMADMLADVDPTMDWAVWISQATQELAGVGSAKELPEGEVARDAMILIANGVANLAEARLGVDFPPVSREEVQKAFSAPNSVGATLEGPDVSLSPKEAEARAAEADGAEATEKPAEETSAASDAPAAEEATATEEASAEPEAESTIVDSGEFNPEKNFRDDAPTGGWKEIDEVLQEIDPSIQWKPIIRQAIAAVYGGDGNFRELSKAKQKFAETRAANAVGMLSQLFTEGTTLSLESVQRSFAAMFDGVVVEVPEFSSGAALAQEDVPPAGDGPKTTENPAEN